MNMQPVINGLIENYDSKLSKTWVNLPSSFALHSGIESLVMCGFLTPEDIQWVWQYGKISFGMNERQFRSLRSRAQRYHAERLRAGREFEKNNARLRQQNFNPKRTY